MITLNRFWCLNPIPVIISWYVPHMIRLKTSLDYASLFLIKKNWLRWWLIWRREV